MQVHDPIRVCWPIIDLGHCEAVTVLDSAIGESDTDDPPLRDRLKTHDDLVEYDRVLPTESCDCLCQDSVSGIGWIRTGYGQHIPEVEGGSASGHPGRERRGGPIVPGRPRPASGR